MTVIVWRVSYSYSSVIGYHLSNWFYLYNIDFSLPAFIFNLLLLYSIGETIGFEIVTPELVHLSVVGCVLFLLKYSYFPQISCNWWKLLTPHYIHSPKTKPDKNSDIFLSVPISLATYGALKSFSHNVFFILRLL